MPDRRNSAAEELLEDARSRPTGKCLTFEFAIGYGQHAQLWALLGAAYSRCCHLSGTPLAPRVARELVAVYLVKVFGGEPNREPAARQRALLFAQDPAGSPIELIEAFIPGQSGPRSGS